MLDGSYHVCSRGELFIEGIAAVRLAQSGLELQGEPEPSSCGTEELLGDVDLFDVAEAGRRD